ENPQQEMDRISGDTRRKLLSRSAAMQLRRTDRMQPVAPSFEPVPKGRGSIKPGTLYAVSGEGGWIYYGQVSPTQDVGFFRHRTRAIMDAPEVLEMEVMCRILIAHRSIGEAVRSGHWRTLGRHEPSPGLLDPCAMV